MCILMYTKCGALDVLSAYLNVVRSARDTRTRPIKKKREKPFFDPDTVFCDSDIC